MQCVADVGEMLEELAGRECEVGQRDYGVCGAVREGLEGLFNEGKKLFDCVWRGNYGARAGEGSGQRGKDAGLVGKVRCEGVVSGFESVDC